jgi:2-polyprenyl-3-methyl-5-hydroxy-6-metoxy-1,4-benzoquinol methylase
VRTRLRDYPSAEELAKLYPVPHDFTRWEDHILRVNVSAALLTTLNLPMGAFIADLSCGNGYLASGVAKFKEGYAFLGDIVSGVTPLDYVGPIEQTLDRMKDDFNDERHADVFICSETLEHLDDPDSVLAKIHDIADILFISTPDGESDNSNPEHIWAWNSTDVEMMLRKAGWKPAILNLLDLRPMGFVYCYQMWVCTR